MRIYIKDKGGKVINLRFPTRLVLNNLTATIGSAVLNKYVDLPKAINLTASQLRYLTRTIYACKRRYPDLYLVDILSSTGDEVKIRL